eukprot:jgi/Botrbrau1/5729/Bobra.0134s0005.1
METLKQGWSRLKVGVGLEAEPDPEPQSLLSQALQQVDEATTLTKTQRAYGFITCLALSLIFGFLASFFLVISPRRFAILYTLSNVLSIASTMFLMGPIKQLSNMFDKGRIFATLAYLVSMFLTLFAALYMRSVILTLFFFAIQICALIWYSISYIPYAREMAWKVIGRCLGD